MYILGISCFYQDSAACLLKDNQIIAAIQQERFSRKKHDFNFPFNAINACLKIAKITPKDLDFVVFYERPLIKFKRILKTHLDYAPLGIKKFINEIPLFLKQELFLKQLIKNKLGYKGKIIFVPHHLSHAAASFYPSPFNEAAFLIIDAIGEEETISFGVGRGNKLEGLYHLDFPHSLGLLYSCFTEYLGFKAGFDEYNLMGLAPYGKPKYLDLILNKLIDLKEDGSFRLNLKYFSYGYSLKMTNSKFEKLFGIPSRRPDSEITQKHMDIASSLQKATEEIILRIVKYVYKTTKKDKLCLSGELALNCVANTCILKEGPFKDIWIQPASTDAGSALGAAYLVWYKYLNKPRQADEKNDKQQGSFLGPCFSDLEIEECLKKENITYQKLDALDIPLIISDLIIQDKIIGWFQGRLEFGPRALGSRSIIADARNLEMWARLNLKVKYRQLFRPFAATILEEYFRDWFDLNISSPYMLFVAFVREDKRLKLEISKEDLEGLAKIKIKRSLIPAVTHVDYSCRIQTLKREDNPLFYDTIEAFYKKTEIPLVINTSFNTKGEPLVCSPSDAIDCFRKTEMDYLLLGSFLLSKEKNLFKEYIKEEVFNLG